MTFLELAQRLRLESGAAGAGPSTVVGQSGELGRFVDWITAAYEDVQNAYSTWQFLRHNFSISTVANIQEYTPSDVSLTELATWKASRPDDLTIYSAVADEQYLPVADWDDFQAQYMIGTQKTQTGRPSISTVKPDNSLIFWPIPNAVYTVTGEYFKKAQGMSLDADEPVIPSQFHMVVVWKALMFYGAYAGAADSYAHGQNEYRSIMRKLEKSQLPQIVTGMPLV